MSLASHNAFTQRGAVYLHERAAQFAYSDGDAAELYLKTVLESAADLSSHSVALQGAIQDWPSEYHLSGKRANLLRGFALRPGARVLELGCGCGAITRYLGEQGMQVDAVEGSAVRAELAALRCRDLDNVSVYCANFNHLELPGQAYDLVCLVGVAEYAARFMDSDERSDPVVGLLERLRDTLAPGGVIALAIENRTGMKYLFGAHEDHYARRYVGINNYFGAWDINTYTLPEWRRIFERSGVRDSCVYLPCPDYKLPTVLLSRDFVTDYPDAFCNLEGVASRDYVDLFRPAVRESLFWQAAAASNTLAAHANSFLFILDMQGSGIDDAYRLDFAHLPGFSRRPECSLVAVKPEGQELVQRRKLVDRPFDSPHVTQKVLDEPYRRGTLLSVLWTRALELEPYSERFINLVGDYVSFVSPPRQVSIDLTPFNIVVDAQGGYHPFDEEWETPEPVTPGFLLFRALTVLAISAPAAISPWAKAREIGTVREFMTHVGERTGLPLAESIDEYTQAEECFQNSIAANRQGNPTRELLDLSVAEDAHASAPVRMRLYWRGRGEAYAEERGRHVLVGSDDARQRITMALPPAAASMVALRFNPAETLRDDGIGFMRIYRMAVSVVEEDGRRTVVWSLDGAERIAEHAALSGIEYASSGLGTAFIVTASDPGLDMPFIPRLRLDGSRALEFEVELRVARSADYLLARDRYLMVQRQLERRLDELHGMDAAQARLTGELESIKASRFWALYRRYCAARLRLDRPLRRLALWRARLNNLGWRRTARRAWQASRERAAAACGRRSTPPLAPTDYETWRELHLSRVDPAPVDGPLISVVMPVYNVARDVLLSAIDSLRRQTYRNWELCIADDASSRADTRAVLDALDDPRISVVRLTENRNISAASNAAVAQARGEYLAFMDNDDALADDALAAVATRINASGADCLYTDEDFIRTDGRLDNPHFKTDFNPDLLLSHNYITHLLVVKRSLFEQVGRLRSDYDGAQDYDLVLRLVEQAQRIEHIASPVYHWRMSEQSTSLNPTIKPQGHGNARRALSDALARRGIDGTVEDTGLAHYFRVRRRLAGTPRVSVIIPFRDRPELLIRCIETILELTTYPDFELVGISNDSCSPATYDAMAELRRRDRRIAFHEFNEQFNFSRLANFGVARATGEHVVLLNNDVEIISPDWLGAMLEHSQRDEVAAVGGKLLYPDNTIQHAGIAIGLGGLAGHPHQRFRADSPGYFNRLNVIQNVSAVTGALLMVEKAKYTSLGGFDTERFGVAYNDVDFCLRAVAAGYLNVFTPHAEAYHLESASRGYEDSPVKRDRFSAEKQNLRARHGAALRGGDPYYNPNFDQGRDDFRFPAAAAPRT